MNNVSVFVSGTDERGRRYLFIAGILQRNSGTLGIIHPIHPNPILCICSAHPIFVSIRDVFKCGQKEQEAVVGDMHRWRTFFFKKKLLAERQKICSYMFQNVFGCPPDLARRMLMGLVNYSGN